LVDDGKTEQTLQCRALRCAVHFRMVQCRWFEVNILH